MKQFEREGVKGSGLVVATGGDVIFEHYIGSASPGVASSAETLWPLASISKLYAGAAALSCLERGEIALSTKLKTLVPEVSGGEKDQINLRQLLTHTAGLPYESTRMSERLANQWNLEQLILEADPEPGDRAAGQAQLIGLEETVGVVIEVGGDEALRVQL